MGRPPPFVPDRETRFGEERRSAWRARGSAGIFGKACPRAKRAEARGDGGSCAAASVRRGSWVGGRRKPPRERIRPSSERKKEEIAWPDRRPGPGSCRVRERGRGIRGIGSRKGSGRTARRFVLPPRSGDDARRGGDAGQRSRGCQPLPRASGAARGLPGCPTGKGGGRANDAPGKGGGAAQLQGREGDREKGSGRGPGVIGARIGEPRRPSEPDDRSSRIRVIGAPIGSRPANGSVS